MPTIDDVAKYTGVSKATVSRVINNTAIVNSETRRKIEKAIQELGYTPSFAAQTMRLRKTKTIIVVIPDFDNTFYTTFFEHVVSLLRGHGYTALIYSTEEKNDLKLEEIKTIISRLADGVIIFTYYGGETYYNYIQELSSKLPVIFMDHIFQDIPVSQVVVDGYMGIKKSCEYFIEKGHRRIGFITGPKNYVVTETRLNGYMDTLQAHNIEIDNHLIYETEFSFNNGVRAAEHFLALDELPTAIVSTGDDIAIGAMKKFLVEGIKVPDQLEIIGFDDMPICRFVSPQLSSVAQPIKQMAKEAVNLLIKKINKPKTKNKKIVFESVLVIRRSSNKHMQDELRSH